MTVPKNSKKILLIEDDQKTAEIIKFVLEQEGYMVVVVASGEAAVRMLDRDIDLIVLDLLMPGMSGFEVLSVIRKDKALKMPIVVLSNLGKEESIERALELGADDYLVKSNLSLNVITMKIKKILEKTRY